MFVSWLPFDSVIKSDAASQRFVIDSGYDLDDDINENYAVYLDAALVEFCFCGSVVFEP